MTFAYAVHVRAVQALFTIIVLGLTAYDASAWSWNWSPSEVNFLLFVSIWTILALAYLMITPGRYEVAAHKFGILAAETVTMIFWFAGWVALASLLGDIRCGSRWGPCRAAIAATIFGAFEWLLWCATAVMAALHFHRTRNTSNTKHDPAIEVHQGN